MTQDESFLQSIREDPDDDAMRLIYADWLEERGDPHGEFIRVQVELARTPPSDPRVPEWKQRQRELVEAHGAQWLAPLRALLADDDRSDIGWGRSVRAFQRGFVEKLTMRARTFVARGELLLHLAPLRQLWLEEAGNAAAALAGCPQLVYVEDLNFSDYYRAPLDAAGMRELAASPYLGRLQQLHLYRNNLGDDGVRALASAPWLSGVRVLNLTENGLSSAGVVALAAAPHLKALTALLLGKNWLGTEGVRALAGCPALAELRTLTISHCQLEAAALECLAGASVFANLHTLELNNNLFGAAGATVLAGAPRLTGLCTLNLSGCVLGNEGVEALLPWPQLDWLTSLLLHQNGITDRGAAVLAAAPLSRLSVLGLYGNRISEAGREVLRTSPHLQQLSTLNF